MNARVACLAAQVVPIGVMVAAIQCHLDSPSGVMYHITMIRCDGQWWLGTAYRSDRIPRTVPTRLYGVRLSGEARMSVLASSAVPGGKQDVEQHMRGTLSAHLLWKVWTRDRQPRTILGVVAQ